MALTENEQYWFARVNDAQASCMQAVEDQQRAIEGLDKALVEPDVGIYAAEQANRAARLALDELLRCQDELVRLVLR